MFILLNKLYSCHYIFGRGSSYFRVLDIQKFEDPCNAAWHLKISKKIIQAKCNNELNFSFEFFSKHLTNDFSGLVHWFLSLVTVNLTTTLPFLFPISHQIWHLFKLDSVLIQHGNVGRAHLYKQQDCWLPPVLICNWIFHCTVNSPQLFDLDAWQVRWMIPGYSQPCPSRKPR